MSATPNIRPRYQLRRNIGCCVLACLLLSVTAGAQRPAITDTVVVSPAVTVVTDSLILEKDAVSRRNKTGKQVASPAAILQAADSSVFNPDPMRAVWYSALFPGLGQIYNRRYWKLPIVVGGYMGLIYATSWNGRYYTDYSTAYRDIMDNDPNTNSYLNFINYPNRNEAYVQQNLEWFKSSFKRKKDFYRRNRDLCIISMVGLYLVCMVDAYVDAQLYHFDISPDVSMHLLPAVFNTSPYSRPTLGLQCAITF